MMATNAFGQPLAAPSTTQPAGGGASPPPSPDLQSLAQSMGLNLTGLTGFTQQSDPPSWDGSKTVPRSQGYTDFYKLTGDDLRQFQERAFTAGLYGTMSRGQVRFGDHDTATLSIWKDLVDRSVGYTANGVKVSPLAALEEAQSNPTNQQQPLTAQVSSPVDLRASLRDAARSAFGAGKLSDADIERFVNDFQSRQEAAQQSQYDQAQGSGGTTVAPPTAANAADDYLQRLDPTQYDSHKVVGAFDAIAQLMRGQG